MKCPICNCKLIELLTITGNFYGDYRCSLCSRREVKYIWTAEELEKYEMKKAEFTWTHANTIIDIKFILLPKRDWFNKNIRPITELLKASIPATSREYNPNTSKWSIAAEYWPATKRLLELSGFTLVETKWSDPSKIPGINVPEEYAKNFHYESEVVTTKESAASIAEQLSKFLGVEITTQNVKDLKKLYRTKAMELHPDRNSNPEAASNMSELNRLWTLYNQGGVQ